MFLGPLARFNFRLGVFVIGALFACMPSLLSAATTAELQAQIDLHNAQIAQLEKDIASYQSQLNQVSTQKQTLQTALTQLDLSRKKINASISVSQNQIDAKTLEIQELGKHIGDKEASIEDGEAGLSESLRRLHENDSQSLIEVMLGSESLAEMWDGASTLTQFQNTVHGQIQDLEAAKQDLESAKEQSEEKQAELVTHRNELKNQQHELDVNRQQQSALLAQTKNQESNYQKLIAQKQTAKAQFEKELTDYEAQLKFTLDPSSIPTTGKGVLHWPLTNVRITQYFGDTDFAKTGAYSGKGHNGIDLAASIGTPLHAALSGTVEGTGNTDLIRGCYSYGKWVLIRHGNGLTTLYGHLSEIDVSAGQQVSTGQVIGYTGFTGYATGPHLHFTVLVSDAVQIIRLGSVRSASGCSAAVLPVAALNGYLDPMSYLPPL